MKRKVAKKVGKLRLSPNEEAQILKEELERRRKLRLQQVREQERYIALQVRKEVKQRRDRELQNLAEELRVEWQREQAEKARALETHYLNSLEAVGEGHRGAKENEPDWAAIAWKVAASNQKAEERHKEALKELKTQRQKQLEEQTRHIKAWKQALLLEKERASRVASLPTPQDPLENIEVKKHPAVKMYDVNSFSVTHYHLPEPCVNREVDTEQLDARVAAEEESKRLDELQKEEEQERREQLEKARLRGGHALRMVHLAQERLMKELEQMQHADLNRRRQVVAQMPLQLFEPPYRRLEIKEDWQRDLEFAFEDMYAGDKKVKGDLVLRLEPEPLPAPSTGSQDEDLDLTLEPEAAVSTEEGSQESEPVSLPDRTEGPDQDLTRQAASKQALKKLFSKIRTQRDQWTSRSESETASEAMTIDSGSLASQVVQHPTSSVLRNDDQLQHQALIHHPEVPETMMEEPIVAGSTTLLHPKEQAIQIQSAAQRKKQEEELELKKQQQIALLQQLEAQKRSLEIHLQKAQLEREQIQAQMQDNRKTNVNSQAPYEEEHAPSVVVPEQMQAFPPSLEDDHLQKIHHYQQRLLEQNQLHKQSVEEARRRLEEYQIMLKKRYPSLSTVPLDLNAAYTKPEVELASERKQPNWPDFIAGTKRLDCLPPGPLNLQKPEWQEQREALHSRLTALGEKRSEYSLKGGELRGIRLSQTENHLQPEMLTVHPIPTPHFNNSALGSDSQQMQTQLSRLNTERALKDVGTEQHTERHLEPATIPISQVEPVHMAIQGTSDSGMTEVDIRRFIEVSKNDVVPLEGQSPKLLMGTFEPRCQRNLIVYPEDSSFPKPSETPCDQESRLASSVEIQARQGQLRELQEQLDRQREALQSRQRVQEESLTHKQDQLKEHMKRQQEALEMFLTDKQFEQTAVMPETSKAEQFNLMTSLLQALEKSDCTLDESHSTEHQSNMPSQENENKMPSCYHQTFMQSGTTAQNVRHGQDHQLSRPLKPPVAKPRLGLLGVIEQHELSAIQEVETPISDSLLGGDDDDFSVAMDGGMKEENGVSKLSLGNKEGSCSESSKSTGRLSRLSWREMLMMETRTFSEQAPSSDPTHSVAVDLPFYSADIGRGVLSYPGPVILRFKSSNKVMHPQSDLDPLFIPFHKTSEQDCMSSTTISTGSLSTNEQDVGSTDVSLQSSQRMQGRYLAGKAGSHSSTSVFMTPSPECPGVIETSVPVSHGAESSLNGSRIQRIIDKYTKELNQSLDDGNGSPAGMDISDSDCHLPLRFEKPDSSLQFQALEPRPDYSISMSSSSQQSRMFENHSEDSNTSTQRNVTGFNAEQLHINSPTGPEAEAPDVSNEITVGRIQGNITFAPPAGLDISDFEDSHFHLPSDVRRNFQPLEPRPDFDISTFSSSMRSQRHSVVSNTTAQKSLIGSNTKQATTELTTETPNVSNELTLGSIQDYNMLGSPAGMDISDSDCHLPLRFEKPDSSLQFQALEPSPDYSISMSSSSQQSTMFENLSEDSNTSTQRNVTGFKAEQLHINSPTGPEAEAPDVSNEITVGRIQGNITFAPPAGLDISDFEDSHFHLPSDVRRNFQPLEPRPDFDISTFSSSMRSQRHSVVSNTTAQRSLIGSNAKLATASKIPNVNNEVTLGSIQDNNMFGELHISDLHCSNLNSTPDSRELFQALEPRPDFDIATFSSSQQSQRHTGMHSCEDHSEDSDIPIQRRLIWSNAEQLPSGPVTPIPEVSCELTVGSIRDDSTFVDQASDSSSLQPDAPLSENSQNVECPAPARLTAERLPEQVRLGNMMSSASNQYLQQGMVQDEEFGVLAAVSQDDTEFSRLSETSLEHLRRQSLEHPHDQQQESFYQLATTQSTISDSVLCEPQIADSLKCGFAEKVEDEHHLHNLNGLQSDLCDLHANDYKKPVSQQSVPQITSSENTVGQAANQDELKLEASVKQHSITETSKDLGTFKSNFSIPVWVKYPESGTGIMEEPDLTLMSLNETTLLEQELSNSNREETTGNRSVKPTCMSENLQLENTEVNKSKPLTEGFQSSQSKTSVMLLEFSSSPGSLQKFFLKKKKGLIQKSSKRVEMIKTRETPLAVKTPESLAKDQNSQNRAEVPSSAQVCLLKKVGEVKVCTPEQRNANETEMYQRTERLYNQLDEVRHRKDIKMRQEAYAKNREKAKEFQKKTLQKLRAKQMKC
ncbi:centrosomal protein of 295 kDa isoform X2 [Acipenser ruthenus]|uniref:centrosomal protein of 295 kDa isoform X2 n=1 Tax=Acipenser ruthenus TaxID=7906 RepID=UPI0027423091|nr:centrosomal protein of 295 kDa isoform X2 [Acipenser ruthenus]